MKNIKIQFLAQKFKKDKGAILALIFLAGIIILSLLAPLLPVDPNKLNVADSLKPPSSQYWFGTDEMGRDYLVRSIYGGRVSLLVGFLAMLTSISLGVTVGIISGYFGGKIDSFLMRFIDLISSIPWIILVTVVSLFLKKGVISVIIVLGFFTWMETARIIRAETLSIKEREYIKYSTYMGIKPLKIMTGHIFPAVLPTLITSATTTIAGVIMSESALSFLGLGVQQPVSSWGNLLQTAQRTIQKAPYMAVLPGILIFLTVLSFNKLGDFLRTSLRRDI